MVSHTVKPGQRRCPTGDRQADIDEYDRRRPAQDKMQAGLVEPDINGGSQCREQTARHDIGEDPAELGEQENARLAAGAGIRAPQGEGQAGGDATAHADAVQAGSKTGQKTANKAQIGKCGWRHDHLENRPCLCPDIPTRKLWRNDAKQPKLRGL